jgi:hypothetical protein
MPSSSPSAAPTSAYLITEIPPLPANAVLSQAVSGSAVAAVVAVQGATAALQGVSGLTSAMGSAPIPSGGGGGGGGSGGSAAQAQAGNPLIWTLVSFLQGSALLGTISGVSDQLKDYYRGFAFTLGAIPVPSLSTILLGSGLFEEEDLMSTDSSSPEGLGQFVEKLGIPPKALFFCLFMTFLVLELVFLLLCSLVYGGIHLFEVHFKKDLKKSKEKTVTFAISGSIRVGLLSLSGLTLAASYQFVVGGHPFLMFLSAVCLLVIVFIGVLFGLYVRKRVDLSSESSKNRYGSYYDDYKEARNFFFAIENSFTIFTSIVLASATEEDSIQIGFLVAFNLLGFLLCVVYLPYHDRFTQVVQTVLAFVSMLEVMIALSFVVGADWEWLSTAGIFINLATILGTVALMMKDPISALFSKILVGLGLKRRQQSIASVDLTEKETRTTVINTQVTSIEVNASTANEMDQPQNDRNPRNSQIIVNEETADFEANQKTRLSLVRPPSISIRTIPENQNADLSLNFNQAQDMNAVRSSSRASFQALTVSEQALGFEAKTPDSFDAARNSTVRPPSISETESNPNELNLNTKQSDSEENKLDTLNSVRTSIIGPPSISETNSNELNLNAEFSENPAALNPSIEVPFEPVPENAESVQLESSSSQTKAPLRKKMNQFNAEVAEQLQRASIEFNGSFENLQKGRTKKSQGGE